MWGIPEEFVAVLLECWKAEAESQSHNLYLRIFGGRGGLCQLGYSASTDQISATVAERAPLLGLAHDQKLSTMQLAVFSNSKEHLASAPDMCSTNAEN